MNQWLAAGLSNAVLATAVAVAAWLVARFSRRPQLAYCLWLLVLAKLITPPVFSVSLEVPWSSATPETSVEPALDAGLAVSATLHRETPLAGVATPQSINHRDEAGEIQLSTPSDAVVLHRPTAPLEVAVPPSVPWTSRLAASMVSIARSWTSWLAWVWLGGSAIWFALAAARIARFKRLLRHAEPADHALAAEVARLAGMLALRTVPQVRLVHRTMPPMAWSLGRTSTLLLPSGLLARLSADERATLIVHELAHLSRRARLARLLELAAVGLYWWHPVAWWARRNVEQAEEQCCDARVLGFLPGLARQYAETLLAAVDFLADEPAATPLGARTLTQKRFLKRRLSMILSGTAPRRIGRRLKVALAALAVVVLPLSMHPVAAEPSGLKLATLGATLTAADTKAIEARLDKLEKMVETLTEEVRSMRKGDTAGAPPVVVKTVPEADATDVDPNLKEIKVTFSKPMKDGTWSWTQSSHGEFPEITGKIHYDKDKRTCVLPVKLEPGKTYFTSINSEKFKNFRDRSGQPAVPFPLSFTTKK